MEGNFPLRHIYNFVKNWRVKVFETRTSKNGDYLIMKGSIGATKNADGKYEGGMLVDVIIKDGCAVHPALDEMCGSKGINGTFDVDGNIKWTVNTDRNGIKHNNCTIWAESVTPHVFKKGR